ncbi:hypothetical protein DY000_02005264 [Brassica cretica]|uniref:Uncharacterized protein n=1 Tax=Brassica cretica TaxID=69181 RepID=A0ABQ7CJ30_BRACR|nr:hypothetical protein DY000_02005264 [Brassica cretica]
MVASGVFGIAAHVRLRLSAGLTVKMENELNLSPTSVQLALLCLIDLPSLICPRFNIEIISEVFPDFVCVNKQFEMPRLGPTGTGNFRRVFQNLKNKKRNRLIDCGQGFLHSPIGNLGNSLPPPPSSNLSKCQLRWRHMQRRGAPHRSRFTSGVASGGVSVVFLDGGCAGAVDDCGGDVCLFSDLPCGSHSSVWVPVCSLHRSDLMASTVWPAP